MERKIKKNLSIKRDRFRNVASKRVQKVLDSIESLSKCANKNNYEYMDEEVAKMMKVIKEQVRILEMTFSEKSRGKKKTFQF